MNKHIRFIILVACVVAFLSLTPIIVAYSLGYRVDFEQRKIVATGGIYLRVWPENAEIYINSKLSQKTAMFSNSFFVQDLLPKNHLVTVKKDGYFDYQKTLEVKAKEVTKLEHITLFKKNVPFEIISDKTRSPFERKEQFIIKNNNLYDNTLIKPALLIKGVIAFDVYQNNIYWVSEDNLLYKSDFSGKEKTKIFDSFYSPIKNIKISPDGQKILYSNDYEISFARLNLQNPDKVFLNRFSEKIGEIFWLNNDYIIFTLAGKIKISEIDNNNETNIVDITPSQGFAKIYFGQQDKKLYILSGENLLASEQLVQ